MPVYRHSLHLLTISRKSSPICMIKSAANGEQALWEELHQAFFGRNLTQVNWRAGVILTREHVAWNVFLKSSWRKSLMSDVRRKVYCSTARNTLRVVLREPRVTTSDKYQTPSLQCCAVHEQWTACFVNNNSQGTSGTVLASPQWFYCH